MKEVYKFQIANSFPKQTFLRKDSVKKIITYPVTINFYLLKTTEVRFSSQIIFDEHPDKSKA